MIEINNRGSPWGDPLLFAVAVSQGSQSPLLPQPGEPLHAASVDKDDFAAGGDAACRQLAKQPPHRLAAVDRLKGQIGRGAEILYPLPEGRAEFGVATVVVIERDAPAGDIGSRGMEATHLVSDKAASFQYRNGEDLLPIPFASDQARQSAAAGAGQYPEIRREGHFADQFSATPGMASGLLPPSGTIRVSGASNWASQSGSCRRR